MPFVLGLNHQSASVDIREKLAIAPDQLKQWLNDLKASSNSEGLVCLSTCNRTEIYAQAANRTVAREAVQRLLESKAGSANVADSLYYFESEDAVQHLFMVAAGLDSMVQGEHEILAQVKQAYQTAHEAGFTGKLLNVLFQRSLFVGKRVRTETALGEGSASVGSVAVGMAQRIFGDLTESTVLILGAGQMAEATAKSLLGHKVRSLLVANRTFERACELAATFNGTAMHFDEGLRQLAVADIVVCSTAAPNAVITPDHINAVMDQRRGRSLFLIDIAMPRNVDPSVNDIENVYLYNIDDLQQIVNDNETRRAKEAKAAAAIVQSETREFTRWLRAHREGLRTGLKHQPLSSSALSGSPVQAE